MFGASRRRRIRNALRRNPLTVFFYITSLTLVIGSFYGLYDLLQFAKEQESSLERQRLQSDLKAFVGALTNDDGALVRYNLAAFVEESRKLTPLISPKRYFIAEPIGELPVQVPSPPQACFVNFTAPGDASDSLAACAYVVRDSGWLYVHLVFLQPQLAGYVQDAHTPLHDTVVISFAEAGSSRAWRLSFMATDDRNHYRISADPLTVASTDLQDAGEYFQGWALTADSGQVMAMLRFRYAALGDAHVAERRAAVWPPSIRKLEIRFERADLVSGQARRIVYGEHGSARRTLRDI